jgi:hypothetical protein
MYINRFLLTTTLCKINHVRVHSMSQDILQVENYAAIYSVQYWDHCIFLRVTCRLWARPRVEACYLQWCWVCQTLICSHSVATKLCILLCDYLRILFLWHVWLAAAAEQNQWLLQLNKVQTSLHILSFIGWQLVKVETCHLRLYSANQSFCGTEPAPFNYETIYLVRPAIVLFLLFLFQLKTCHNMAWNDRYKKSQILHLLIS